MWENVLLLYTEEISSISLDDFTLVEPRLVKLRLFAFNQLKFHLSLILYVIWLNACIFAQKRRENFSVRTLKMTDVSNIFIRLKKID